MTRPDVLKAAAEAGYPRVAGFPGLTGQLAWERFVRVAPVGEVNRALHCLRQQADPQTNPWMHPNYSALPSAQSRRVDDAARVRRLQEARTPPVAAQAPGGPTAEHWREVRLAVEKFCGIGEYAHYRVPVNLPAFSLSWDDPGLFGHPTRLGAVGVHRGGELVIYLRSDVSPARVHATMIHELQHVFDHAYVRPITSRSPWHDERAYRVQAELAWL